MDLFMDLFSDTVGLFSLGTIVFLLGMAAYFVYIFITKSANPEE